LGKHKVLRLANLKEATRILGGEVQIVVGKEEQLVLFNVQLSERPFDKAELGSLALKQNVRVGGKAPPAASVIDKKYVERAISRATDPRTMVRTIADSRDQ